MVRWDLIFFYCTNRYIYGLLHGVVAADFEVLNVGEGREASWIKVASKLEGKREKERTGNE